LIITSASLHITNHPQRGRGRVYVKRFCTHNSVGLKNFCHSKCSQQSHRWWMSTAPAIVHDCHCYTLTMHVCTIKTTAAVVGLSVLRTYGNDGGHGQLF